MMYRFTFCRMDALACGALVALLVGWQSVRPFVQRYATTALIAIAGFFLIGAVLSRVYAVDDPTTIVAGYTLTAVLMAGLLLAAITEPVTRCATVLVRALSCRSLRSVGKYSYAMYIVHLPMSIWWNEPLMALVQPLGRLAPFAFSTAIVIASYGVGVLSYHLFEKWFLHLKRYFVPRPAESS